MAETAKDTGGPAFPTSFNVWNDGFGGMFLLDWFAGQALVGLGNADVSYEVAAKTCYDQADAMVAEHNRRLAARKQEQPDA